jgi:MFS family permease
MVLLAGTNLPTPLYHSYERAFHFSALVVTLIFAAYVGTLIISLLLLGPLSDAIGRRRVLVPALGAAMVGSGVFAAASGTTWLFAARMIQGVAVGAASGALTAALVELEPRGDRQRAAMVSATALFTGIGLGPLLSGTLAQYIAEPRVMPYLLEIALIVVAGPAVARLRDDAARPQWRARRPQVPAAIRGTFISAATVSFLAGSVTGLFLSLVPSYLLELTGSSSLALAGASVALMFGASAVTQRLAYSRPPPLLRIAGLLLMSTAFVLLILAGTAASLSLLLAATLSAGVGQGLAFLAAITAINDVAPAERRADILSSFYVVTYLGTGLPVIGAGFLATSIGLLDAVQCFAAVMATICLLVFALDRVPRPAGRRA